MAWPTGHTRRHRLPFGLNHRTLQDAAPIFVPAFGQSTEMVRFPSLQGVTSVSLPAWLTAKPTEQFDSGWCNESVSKIGQRVRELGGTEVFRRELADDVRLKDAQVLDRE
jgi:hypothetical protein